MMKCLYLVSVVFHVAAGCALSGDKLTEITRHKGDSALLPCSCPHLNTKTQKLTWGIYRTGRPTEMLNDKHYSGRFQLFNNISPDNLSLLISDLRVEDQGIYRCSTGPQKYREIYLYVNGCELVKKTEVEHVTVFTGESVVLPCSCTDIQDKPQGLKWEFTRNNQYQEIYPKQTGRHRNRVKLVSNNSPGNLSLLISHLTEEDQGDYRCSVQNNPKITLYVKVNRRETSTNTNRHQHFTILGILVGLLLVIAGIVAFICWRHRGGKCGEKMITEGCQDCKEKQNDQ
ncbi:neogenin-like isoform X7, partial [Clarias magur]